MFKELTTRSNPKLNDFILTPDAYFVLRITSEGMIRLIHNVNSPSSSNNNSNNNNLHILLFTVISSNQLLMHSVIIVGHLCDSHEVREVGWKGSDMEGLCRYMYRFLGLMFTRERY